MPWISFLGAFLGSLAAPFFVRAIARVFAPGEAVEERRSRRLRQIEDMIDVIREDAVSYWSDPPAPGTSRMVQSQARLVTNLHEVSRLLVELVGRSKSRQKCIDALAAANGSITGADFDEPATRTGEELAEMGRYLVDLKREVVNAREQMRRPLLS